MSKNEKIESVKVNILKLELIVCTLPDIEEKKILQREIELAKKELNENRIEYPSILTKKIKRTIKRIRFRIIILPHESNTNIQLIIKGIVLYSLIVFCFGICAVIVNVYNEIPTPFIVELVKSIGLDPLFKTVISLDITQRIYHWGLLGGAGVVVSMINRFKTFEESSKSKWLYFAVGLFKPILGSLTAIMACRIASVGIIEAYKDVPLIAIAFFSGFSEKWWKIAENHTKSQ